MQNATGTLLAVLLVSGLALVTAGCLFSAPRYRGAKTDHFDGARFHNQDQSGDKRFGDFVKWMRTRKPGPWREWRDEPPGPPPPRRVESGELRITFVNHATVLLQLDGKNILTDPIWSERGSPVGWAGPRRHRPPGIRFEDLPPIDLVLVGHNHYDHLDLPTLRRLERRDHPLFVTGLGNGALLVRKGLLRVGELDWWQRLAVTESLRVTFVPAQHFSSRGLADRNGTLWGGFVVEASGRKVYFASDTGFGPQFAQIAERFGPVDLALLPIGAYRPQWFMGPVHLSPGEAVVAHRTLKARRSMAIHFGTFRLADDGEEEPIYELRRAMTEAGLGEDDFWVLGFGEGRSLPPGG